MSFSIAQHTGLINGISLDQLAAECVQLTADEAPITVQGPLVLDRVLSSADVNVMSNVNGFDFSEQTIDPTLPQTVSIELITFSRYSLCVVTFHAIIIAHSIRAHLHLIWE